MLRTLAYLTWELGMLSVLAAGVLRLRAWAVMREGRTAQFASVSARFRPLVLLPRGR